MKKLSSLLFLILFLVSGYAQQIQWAKKRQVPYGDASEIITDKWGNIYEYGGTSYQSKSYLQKFSSLGDSIFSITWQPNFYISKLIYNGEDHFYFAGYFSNEHTYNGITIKSRGGRDGMFGRMDLNGNIEWLKSIGGPGMNSVNSIYFNQITNQLIITGGIENEIYLNNNFQGNFSQSAFIATLNLQGDLIYLKTYDFLDNLDEVYGSNAGIEVTGDNSGIIIYCLTGKGYIHLKPQNPELEDMWEN